jgi:SAM-dependent methyltransferase
MKDLFSSHSDQYAKYRPQYPGELFDFLNSIIKMPHTAWDCGTGNGQVAFELAKTFERVFATDISQEQIKNALQADNIEYSVQPAEHVDFQNRFFDLIIVAQAIHWFDFEKFYSEVRRTGKKDAILCIIGYGRIEVNAEIDREITAFYKNIVGPYWDKERRYIDQNYKTIPFPFEEMDAPGFVNKLEWNTEQLIGYINTWSAVKHFIKENGYNPVDDLKIKVAQHWGEQAYREGRFPLLLRIGRIS